MRRNPALPGPLTRRSGDTRRVGRHPITGTTPARMLGRPHQFSVRARPNCQASSQRWGKPERGGGHRAESQSWVRWDGRAGLRGREDARSRPSRRHELRPASFITTPISSPCQANHTRGPRGRPGSTTPIQRPTSGPLGPSIARNSRTAVAGIPPTGSRGPVGSGSYLPCHRRAEGCLPPRKGRVFPRTSVLQTSHDDRRSDPADRLRRARRDTRAARGPTRIDGFRTCEGTKVTSSSSVSSSGHAAVRPARNLRKKRVGRPPGGQDTGVATDGNDSRVVAACRPASD